jgi:hypothetical protein
MTPHDIRAPRGTLGEDVETFGRRNESARTEAKREAP